MSMLHPVHQRSEAWHLLRCGRPTASDFDNLVTDDFAVRKGQMPLSYLYLKLAEAITGFQPDSGGSFAMEQGNILEEQAIPFLELIWDRKIKRIGFITDDAMRVGCSPDGLLSDEEGLEIKCPLAPKHIEYLMAGVLPKCYGPQVHGSMYVSGFKVWTFISYHRKLPPLVIRVERDEKIQAAIGAAVDQFLRSFDEAFARIQAMKEAK